MPTLLIAKNRDELPEGVLDEIRSLAPDYDIEVTREEADIKKLADSIEIAAGSVPHDVLKALPALKWFQQWGAGADWLRHYPELQRAPFTLTNASGVHPIQIGEHVFALLLALARRLPTALDAQREHRWLDLGNGDTRELYGKTMLLVGVGAIGERIAHLGQALDMTVVGVRRDPSKGAAGVERMVATDALADELPGADVVVLTVPLTEATRNMLGEKELGLMKEDAYLVNIGRGGTIDETALIKQLEAGRFRGVGLDVFEEEPLREDSPLWDEERVIITSHYAGNSPHYDERAFKIFTDNLQRFVAREDLENVVDKESGY